MKANFQTAAAVLDEWKDDVLSGTPPTLYPCGRGDLGQVEIGPGMVTLIGGAPGAGKTALSMQLVMDALRITPTLRACVCNIEMKPAVLLERQLARLSGIDLSLIRHRTLTEAHGQRIEQGFVTLEPLCDRLAFVSTPFDLANVAATFDEFKADLLLLDYIQRIRPPEQHDTHRTAVNQTMDYLRQFADADVAVIVVSAVGRTKDGKGRSSYDGEGLNLASFRESSELEFGADDAFILTANHNDGDVVKLRHLKSRHGECRNIQLYFDRKLQRFESMNAGRTGATADGHKKGQLSDLWNRTTPADDDESEDGE